VQVTTLPSPTSGAQSLTFVHEYWQSAPHAAWQVLVRSHETVQPLPHDVAQFGPSLQAT
jgi:hypothetical protein